ncbi:MAG TPA: FliA/WhiG family RNA polymerase sigma factor [Firmicutes bacterium]|nr:FliA/WhiG family RNA polymerase sigma factor [Bacillota bacterium]
MRSSAEAQALWARYKGQGDRSAREELAVNYLPLVKYVAGRIRMTLPAFVEEGDLVGYGVLGLLDALQKFDPGRGVKFETYAVTRIRGAILDGLRAVDWVPAHVRQRVRDLQQAYSRVEGRLGRAATDEEMAEELGITVVELHDRVNEAAATSLVSLEGLWAAEAREGPVLSSLPDREAPDPTELAEWEEKKEVLAWAIARLPEREKTIVSLFYYEGLTLKEISRLLKVSPGRVSQLHAQAMLRLRAAIERVEKEGIAATLGAPADPAAAAQADRVSTRR